MSSLWTAQKFIKGKTNPWLYKDVYIKALLLVLLKLTIVYMDNSSKGYNIKYSCKVLQLFYILQCSLVVVSTQWMAFVMCYGTVTGFVVVSAFLWRLRLKS